MVSKLLSEPVDLRELAVLVVDDNATNRRILEEMPTNWGMRTTAVEGSSMETSSGDVFDAASVLARVEGDKELLGELVGLFLEDSSRLMSEMREAIACGDGQALEHAAHTLKGSVGNFGAQEAFDAARRLEVMGGEDDLEGAQARYAELEKEIERLRPALAGLAERRS